jgi:ribonucleoside-triphosphate reductase
MYRVKKRNGSIVEFDISKITGAIRKAFDACERNYTGNIIDMIGLKVTSAYEPLIRDNLIEVEDIQDCVERTLSEAGYSDVAKAYILYRKSRENVRNIDVTSLDYKMLVDNYLDAFEWHDKDDSTITYSVGGLILSNSGAITANYWLSEVYDNEIAEAHRSGDIHMHDL